MNDEDQAYYDYLLERQAPRIPQDAVELAQSDNFTAMGTEMAGGTEPPGATPMTLRQFGETVADTPASLLKGRIQGQAGLIGDTIALGRGIVAAINPNPGEDRLDAFLRAIGDPVKVFGYDITTEGISKILDETLGPVVPAGSRPGRAEVAETAETTGEIFGLSKAASEAAKVAGRITKSIGREIATTPPIGSINLEVIPVKIAGREVSIPAQQSATLQKAVKNLTPEEQSKFKSNTAKSFIEMLSSLPSKQEFGAAALGGKAKKGWYEGSTQAIVNVFGPDANRFAALLSATSPQTSVESNLYNALQIWKNWTAAGRPVDRESIVRVMGQSVQGGKGEESVLDAWINNSVRALSAEDPSQIMLSGPKVDSFMRNLQGNVNEVTNDAWMASFALVDQKIFGGSLTKSDPGKGPGYLAMNARVRETADYLTKLTGEKWTPAEVQETIWSWAKTLYETAGSAGEQRSAVQLIKDNAITDELIASTPDFRTLFYDSRFQPILEQAGYGEQLAQLRAATSRADVGAGGQKPGASGQASAIDPEAQRKLNERNARRLDKLRKQREQAAKEKAAFEGKEAK